MSIPHRADTVTPLRFAAHIDAATRSSVRVSLSHDAADHMTRALAAAKTGDVAEFERCLSFAADSASLAVRLGATPAEVAAGLAAARQAGGAL